MDRSNRILLHKHILWEFNWESWFLWDCSAGRYSFILIHLFQGMLWSKKAWFYVAINSYLFSLCIQWSNLEKTTNCWQMGCVIQQQTTLLKYLQQLIIESHHTSSHSWEIIVDQAEVNIQNQTKIMNVLMAWNRRSVWHDLSLVCLFLGANYSLLYKIIITKSSLAI